MKRNSKKKVVRDREKKRICREYQRKKEIYRKFKVRCYESPNEVDDIIINTGDKGEIKMVAYDDDRENNGKKERDSIKKISEKYDVIRRNSAYIIKDKENGKILVYSHIIDEANEMYNSKFRDELLKLYNKYKKGISK